MFVHTKKIITLNSELWKVLQTVKTLWKGIPGRKGETKVENIKMKDRCWTASNIISNTFQYKANGGKSFKITENERKLEGRFLVVIDF